MHSISTDRVIQVTAGVIPILDITLKTDTHRSPGSRGASNLSVFYPISVLDDEFIEADFFSSLCPWAVVA